MVIDQLIWDRVDVLMVIMDFITLKNIQKQISWRDLDQNEQISECWPKLNIQLLQLHLVIVDILGSNEYGGKKCII